MNKWGDCFSIIFWNIFCFILRFFVRFFISLLILKSLLIRTHKIWIRRIFFFLNNTIRLCLHFFVLLNFNLTLLQRYFFRFILILLSIILKKLYLLCNSNSIQVDFQFEFLLKNTLDKLVGNEEVGKVSLGGRDLNMMKYLS